MSSGQHFTTTSATTSLLVVDDEGLEVVSDDAGLYMPSFKGVMFLVKRWKERKNPANSQNSATSSSSRSSSSPLSTAKSKSKSKHQKGGGGGGGSKHEQQQQLPEFSSLELSITTHESTSTHISKESDKDSKPHSAKSSSSQESPLPNNIKGMLSDGAIIFQVKELSKATQNFSASKKLGASVYRGRFKNADVAVVVAQRGGRLGSTKFVPELKDLCSVHHSNLVKILGGCENGDQFYLVYEFINGGSLRQCLWSEISPRFTSLPTWTSRLQVALDVAQGLEYLHHHTHTPSVHKYIKSSNILIDSDLHAKIAYFGVARMKGETEHEIGAKSITEEFAEGDQGKVVKDKQQEIVEEEIKPEHIIHEEMIDHSNRSRHHGRILRRSHSIKITGTQGYMAPEYLNGGVISPKLDVYAFGVILLEILSGKMAVTFQPTAGTTYSMKKTILADVITGIFADTDPQKRVRVWMDSRLRDNFPVDCAFRTAQLAKTCVDPDPLLRPDMSHASVTLNKILNASKAWEEKMKASREYQTSTMQPR